MTCSRKRITWSAYVCWSEPYRNRQEPMQSQSGHDRPRLDALSWRTDDARNAIIYRSVACGSTLWVDHRRSRRGVEVRIRSGLVALTALLALAGCNPSTAAQGNQNTTISSARASATAASPTIAPTSPAAATHAASTPPTQTTAATSSSGLIVAGSTLTGSAPAPGACHVHAAANGQPLPDPKCSPGAIDKAVTQVDIATTICRTGYTTTVRPPVSVTEPFKLLDERAYGVYSGELDHLVPLELGGSSDAHNLWVEPGAIPNPKDRVENELHAAVCAGSMTLAAAQAAIARDWTTALPGAVPTVVTTTRTATTPPTAAATASKSATSSTVVHAGSFCSTKGATGVTSAGSPEVCRTSSTDARLRWRAPQ